ncbi:MULTISPECIES: hypothetical protein [unclassified Streptomyces]|uniref:hypothetical protein n=1 Tax=unclassified Streptomyces TaxID=2593676 RepID=UPI002ED6817E|nr:hypothetical protein OH827_15720 [Streptomyces sp. NBC_00891]WSY06370.1 hypothetical protein OG464_15720 [Streptomyces sp. NBC_00890]WSZ07994.1 hypothetical protein OG704_15720 [Streptomyces sp. NBC_00869]WSZ24506.1 hypothetical protein OG498_17845 [Streptomyces sp. NBC_00870]
MDSGSYAARLNQVVVSDSRELDRVCEEVALALHRDGTEPPFDVVSSDFAADPYLICADRYWRLRLLERPSIRTAAACSLWISAHVSREARVEVLEKWALGYAFITKDSVESAVELAQGTEEIVSGDTSAGDVAYFASLYHAGKLRSDFLFEELHRFLDASLLALAAGTHRQSALFTALRSFAAFGSPAVTAEHAVGLLDQAWHSADRTRHVVDICLNGIQFANRFDGHGELLRDRAAEAVRDHPGDHMFHFRLATGLHMTGDHDAALSSVDTALRLLPAVGSRGSHKLLQEQYLTKREVIVEGRQRAALDAGHRQRLADREARYQERWARSEEEMRRRDAQLSSALRASEESARANHVRAVELVALFSSVIAFAVGSLQVTLTGDFSLRDRLLLIGAWGAAHALFALLVIGGTWLITRPRRA